MAFPTGVVVPTTNLSTAAGDPSLARAELFTGITAVNDIISSANQASGIAMLSAAGLYDGTKLPTTITATNVIAPSSGVLNIQDIIRLTTITATDLTALTGNALGDIAISSDAAAGNPALCLYDGSNWRYLAMGNLTIV